MACLPVLFLFTSSEQVDQEGGKSSFVQYLGNELIARAMPAAAAAVCEKNYSTRIFRYIEIAFKRDIVSNLHLICVHVFFSLEILVKRFRSSYHMYVCRRQKVSLPGFETSCFFHKTLLYCSHISVQRTLSLLNHNTAPNVDPSIRKGDKDDGSASNRTC